MVAINVLLLCGGGGSEHKISLMSADFIKQQMGTMDDINIIQVIIEGVNWVTETNKKCYLTTDGALIIDTEPSMVTINIDYAIPCFHGYPGETGEIQTLFKLATIPYLGCGTEASVLCFNKISSKLWFTNLGIKNTPFVYMTENNTAQYEKAVSFFNEQGHVFVKAASQGSSVGCYKAETLTQMNVAIKEAFNFSSQVLIEKCIIPRELEVAAYQLNGKLFITEPGEIIPADHFYDYNEKYSTNSQTTIKVAADNLTKEQRKIIKDYATLAFTALKLKDLARIDFFLTEHGDILINEINTFPGMTPNSLFPKMMEHDGNQFNDFLRSHLFSSLMRC